MEDNPTEFTPPLFAPSTFFDLTRPMEVEAYKLSTNELIAWGLKITQIRAGFASRAAPFEENGGEPYDGAGGEIVRLPRSLQRRYTTKRRGLV